MSNACTNTRAYCDACEQPICRRCGRCFYRVPGPHGTMNLECPSFWCNVAKRLRLRRLTLGSTPDRDCTDPADRAGGAP